MSGAHTSFCHVLKITLWNFYLSTACGKTLTDSKGVFSFSTSELEQLRPMTCTWRISWTAGEKLSLKITHAHFHFKCKKAYLEIRDGSNKKSPLIGRYCKENKPPRNIFPTSKSLWVTFRYGYRYYYDGKPIGFKAEYESKCKYKINIANLRICTWFILYTSICLASYPS